MAEAANLHLPPADAFTMLDQLTGQFRERQEFLGSLKGKKVRWRGYVSYVRNSVRSPLQIVLAITPTPSDAT